MCLPREGLIWTCSVVHSGELQSMSFSCHAVLLFTASDSHHVLFTEMFLYGRYSILQFKPASNVSSALIRHVYVTKRRAQNFATGEQ